MKHVRAAAVFLGGVFVQWWWSSRLSFFGLAPQVLFVLTVAVASLDGPAYGLTMGFCWGLVLDTAGVHLFGGHALSLTLTAYFVGVAKRQMDVSNPLSQGMFAGLATVVYGLFLALLGIVFKGEPYWPGWGTFAFTPVFNAAAAPFGFRIVGRYIRHER